MGGATSSCEQDALESLYKTLRGRDLSSRTIQYVHTVIRKMLADAVKRGHLTRNVADLIERPKARKTEMRVWTAEHLRAFLKHVSEERLYALWLIAATSGMRRGELAGLRWVDVDLEAGRCSIQQALVSTYQRATVSAPKTPKSRRSIPLPAETVAALKSWHARQGQERLKLGEGYEGQGLVFTREDGSPMRPDLLTDSFERYITKAGLPKIRLHDLRHTFATLALQAGEHPKVVSEILGHSSISITLDTYSHVIPAMSEQATSRVAGLIFGA